LHCFKRNFLQCVHDIFLLILQTICWQGRLSSISNFESAWVPWTTTRKEAG
jgi:hypothetical protein